MVEWGYFMFFHAGQDLTVQKPQSYTESSGYTLVIKTLISSNYLALQRPTWIKKA